MNKVAEVLSPLKEHGYSVLQNVELARGKVDNVVVGPSGVYVIDVRRWRGKVTLGSRGRIMCGGFSRERAKRRVFDDTTLVRRQMAAWGIVRPVMPVIMVTGATMPHGPIDLRNLAVVHADQLAGWIRGRQYRLAPIEIEQIRHGLTPHTDEGFWTKHR